MLGLNPLDIHDQVKLNHHLGVLAQDREMFFISCWHLYREENVGAFHQVCAAGDHHRRADLGFQGAGKHANHHIAGLQCDSSGSSVSSRFREAALKSFRSSSVPESDQSMVALNSST